MTGKVDLANISIPPPNEEFVHSIEQEISGRSRAMSCPSISSFQEVSGNVHGESQTQRAYKRCDSAGEIRSGKKGVHEKRFRVIRHLARRIHDTNIFELIEADSEDEIDSSDEDDDEDALITEKTPLQNSATATSASTPARQANFSRRKSIRRAAANSARLAGTAKTVFAIFKSFVGTGILFVPRGFYNAGWFAAILSLALIGFLCTHCILVLLRTKEALLRRGFRVASFGDVAQFACGRHAKLLIELCVLFSQLGFCCAYNVFISKNISEFSRAFLNTPVPEWLVMVLCVPLLTPLTWVRQLKYFAITNLIADAIIIATILAIFLVDFLKLTLQGPAHVVAFNPNEFLMFFGTAVYAFEGIAMIIPIEQSMRNRSKLPFIIQNCMFGFVVMLSLFGLFNYLTFGDQVASIITLNISGALKSTISVAYSFAVFFSFPLMIFPAVKIIERQFFKDRNSGKKWSKNFLRFLAVLLCLLIAVIGKEKVDQMVSIIGALSCAPLALIFPALFHAKVMGNQRSGYEMFLDTFNIWFGVIGLFLATGVSVYTIIYAEKH